MPVLETPSRVWRRIQAADDFLVPSLPSIPNIDLDDDDEEEVEQSDSAVLPLHSTPTSSMRRSSTHNTVRFAETHQSFSISDISSIQPPFDKPGRYDYSVSLKEEPKPSPQTDMHKHVTTRRGTPRARTPSLTRSGSLASTSPNVTPPSDASISILNVTRQSSVVQPDVDPPYTEEEDNVVALETDEDADNLAERTTSPSTPKSHEKITIGRDQTPVNRRRSFALAVLNSAVRPTPRPRMSLGQTPHSRQPSASFTSKTPPVFSTPAPKKVEMDSFVSTASSHDLTTHPRVNASFDLITGAKGVGRFNATKLNSYLHGLNKRLVEENEELTTRLTRFGDSSMAVIETVALEEELRRLEDELKQEKEARQKDKEKFKEKIQALELGVNGVVSSLEQRLEATGKARSDASIRAKKAEELLSELRVEKSQDSSSSDSIEAISILRARNKQLEVELRSADEAMEELKSEHAREVKAVQNEKDAMQQQFEQDRNSLQEELNQTEESSKELAERLETAESNAESLAQELVSIQEELAGKDEDIDLLKDHVNNLESKTEILEREARQMEEALEESEKQMLGNEEELEKLRRELERIRSSGVTSFRSTSRSHAILTSEKVTTPAANSTSPENLPQIEDLEALEAELDLAYKEIARLNHCIHGSPGRIAISKAKDARIELLEKDKAELEERVRTLRVMVSSGLASATAATNISIRAPKTPGGPLRDMSWLQQATQYPDQNASQYLNQMAVLERELAHANENIDDKIDQLEEYGMDVIGLTNKLADAEGRIESLEDEVKRLERKEERRSKRCRCRGGKLAEQSTMDPASMSTAAISYSKKHTEESMRRVLAQLDRMKRDWQDEKQRLVGERDLLQDAANKLNATDSNKYNEAERKRLIKAGERAQIGVEKEMETANAVIAELEDQLVLERSRLRAITTERNRTVNEKNDLLTNLRRTQNDMDAIKEQLRNCKQENYALEADLRSNAVAESRARHLQLKVTENQSLIDQLRRERDALADDHVSLQRKFTYASERAESLRHRLAGTQAEHDSRRHQLDIQIAEIEDLRRENEELERAQKAGEQIRDGVVHTLEALESDLKSIKRDAAQFARDLMTLKAEKEDGDLKHHNEIKRADAVKSQLRTQIRTLESQLDDQKARLRHVANDRDDHICAGDDAAISMLKAQHNKECKGLLVQIHYLKNKFTRESAFRISLTYQKQYLLVTLSRLQNNDMHILAAISKVDFPRSITAGKGAASLKSKKRSIKSITYTLMFVSRIQKAARRWSDQTSSKADIAVALEDVRRRRLMGAERGNGGPLDDYYDVDI